MYGRRIDDRMAVRTARIEVSIYGHRNHWSLAPFEGGKDARSVHVRLELHGDAGSGYMLVQSPDGYFTADNWFVDEGDALDTAHEMYGVTADDWT